MCFFATFVPSALYYNRHRISSGNFNKNIPLDNSYVEEPGRGVQGISNKVVHFIEPIADGMRPDARLSSFDQDVCGSVPEIANDNGMYSQKEISMNVNRLKLSSAVFEGESRSNLSPTFCL